LERFYWYAYEGESSGISVNGQMDLRGFAYATTMRWLKGAMLEGCASPDSVKWVCQLSRGSRKAWIAWATSGDADFIVNGGVDLTTATTKAYAMISNAVDRQAYYLSYLDTFRLITIFFIVVIPLVVFLKTKKTLPENKAAVKAAMAEAH